jgi:hypothetical protein
MLLKGERAVEPKPAITGLLAETENLCGIY